MNRIWEFRFATADELSSLSAWQGSSHWQDSALDDSLPSTDSRVLLACERQSEQFRVLGSIRIEQRIGLDQPRYWYHIGCVVLAAEELGLFQRERTLLLGNDHTGATELSDLQVDRTQLSTSEQSTLQGDLIRTALLLLTLEAAQGNPGKVIYALPGVRDLHRKSPFWEGLGRHFYPGDVDQAQARFGALWLTHVAALLPRHPLIVSLLDPSAQAAIATADSDASELVSALINTGFRAGQHVSLFDAGPVYEAYPEALESPFWRSLPVGIHPQAMPLTPTFVALNLGQSVWKIPACVEQDRLLVSAHTAALSGLAQDQTIWLGAP